jgi:hypothetical protein
MAAHKGPASSRPRCTRGGSPVAAIPVYHLPPVFGGHAVAQLVEALCNKVAGSIPEGVIEIFY